MASAVGAATAVPENVAPPSSSETTDDASNNTISNETRVGDDNETIDKNGIDNQHSMVSGQQDQHPEEHQKTSKRRRPRRIPLHSIGNGHLSAADLHRMQLKEQRQQRVQLQREQSHSMDPTHDRDGVDTASTSHTIPTSRNDRAPTDMRSGVASMGGSFVASQSATARYRQNRARGERTVEDAGGKLKMNPSVVSIPLVDHPSFENDGGNVGGGDSGHMHQQRQHPPSHSNFEERYQKLRRQRQEDDDLEANDKRSWSPFSWFWGKR